MTKLTTKYDLFNEYESLPSNLKQIVKKYKDLNITFEERELFLREVYEIGYTFDFHYNSYKNLRKLELFIEEMSDGFRDREYILVEKEDGYVLPFNNGNLLPKMVDECDLKFSIIFNEPTTFNSHSGEFIGAKKFENHTILFFKHQENNKIEKIKDTTLIDVLTS